MKKKKIVNKRNLLYFNAKSIPELYKRMEKWQIKHEKRFLSVSIHQDSGVFHCIALTNPLEVVITSEDGQRHADVYTKEVTYVGTKTPVTQGYLLTS